MKKLLLFLLVMQSAPVITKTTNCFKDIFLNPLIENEDLLLNYSFEVEKPQFVNFSFTFTYEDGSNVTFDTKRFYIVNTITQAIYAKANLIKDNSILKMTASGTSFFKSIEFTITVVSKKPKNISISNNTFHKENAIQYLDDTGHVHANDETIIIKHRSIYTSSIPFLDLSPISVIYKTYYPYENFEGSKVTIKILDPLNIFPLLSENGIFALNYELIKTSNDTYKLSLYDKLYLDHATGLTSRTSKEGFSQVDKLYFPKNKDNFKLSFYLVINNLGLQRLYASRRIVFNFQDYIGACSSAKYCVQIKESSIHSDENEVKIKL